MMIKVKVRPLVGEDIIFSVDSNMTIRELRGLVKQRTGIDERVQRFIFHGRCIADDNSTFQSLQITDGTVVHMVVKAPFADSMRSVTPPREFPFPHTNWQSVQEATLIRRMPLFADLDTIRGPIIEVVADALEGFSDSTDSSLSFFRIVDGGGDFVVKLKICGSRYGYAPDIQLEKILHARRAIKRNLLVAGLLESSVLPAILNEVDLCNSNRPTALTSFEVFDEMLWEFERIGVLPLDRQHRVQMEAQQMTDSDYQLPDNECAMVITCPSESDFRALRTELQKCRDAVRKAIEIYESARSLAKKHITFQNGGESYLARLLTVYEENVRRMLHRMAHIDHLISDVGLFADWRNPFVGFGGARHITQGDPAEVSLALIFSNHARSSFCAATPDGVAFRVGTAAESRSSLASQSSSESTEPEYEFFVSTHRRQGTRVFPIGHPEAAGPLVQFARIHTTQPFQGAPQGTTSGSTTPGMTAAAATTDTNTGPPPFIAHIHGFVTARPVLQSSGVGANAVPSQAAPQQHTQRRTFGVSVMRSPFTEAGRRDFGQSSQQAPTGGTLTGGTSTGGTLTGGTPAGGNRRLQRSTFVTWTERPYVAQDEELPNGQLDEDTPMMFLGPREPKRFPTYTTDPYLCCQSPFCSPSTRRRCSWKYYDMIRQATGRSAEAASGGATGSQPNRAAESHLDGPNRWMILKDMESTTRGGFPIDFNDRYVFQSFELFERAFRAMIHEATIELAREDASVARALAAVSPEIDTFNYIFNPCGITTTEIPQSTVATGEIRGAPHASATNQSGPAPRSSELIADLSGEDAPERPQREREQRKPASCTVTHSGQTTGPHRGFAVESRSSPVGRSGQPSASRNADNEFPTEWQRVVEEDLRRMESMSPLPPFSDAYLASSLLSSKESIAVGARGGDSPTNSGPPPPITPCLVDDRGHVLFMDSLPQVNPHFAGLATSNTSGPFYTSYRVNKNGDVTFRDGPPSPMNIDTADGSLPSHTLHGVDQNGHIRWTRFPMPLTFDRSAEQGQEGSNANSSTGDGRNAGSAEHGQGGAENRPKDSASRFHKGT